MTGIPGERGRIRAMHQVSIPIRWRDVDNYGHVNNAVYLTYLEECRDRLVEDLFGTDEAWDFVLARVAIDYRVELTQADGEVTVRATVAGHGASSVRTREVIEKRDGSVAAEAEAVIVPRDPATSRSRRLTDAELRTLQVEIERN
jgi:acyl-CoA thioester hydrolase